MPSFNLNSLKFPVTLLLCFLLNVIVHGNLWVSFLNSLLLGLTFHFFEHFSNKTISTIKLPLLVLLVAIPIFNTNHQDTVLVILATGIAMLYILYIRVKFKALIIFTILIYILIAGLYAGEVIGFPFAIHKERLIFNNNRVNNLIADTQNSALYLPYNLRPLIFNSSIYLYSMLATAAEFFLIKNISSALLLANLYPLFKGLILDLKYWNGGKMLICLGIFLIPFVTVSSRSINTFNIYLLMSPLLVYFILQGLNLINKKIYLILILISLFLITSPLK